MEVNEKRWKENLRAMKERVRDRFRTAQAHSFLRHSQQRSSVTSFRRGKTGIVASRLFKGNVVFARISKNLARRARALTKESLFPNFRNLVAGVMGGAFVFGNFSAHADALAQASQEVIDLGAKTKIFRGRGPSSIDDALNEEISENSTTVRVLRAIALPVIGNVCYVFMHGLNRTEVYGLEKLQAALHHRPEGRGLLTVSNHVAAMDDPLITASLLSPQVLLHERMLRWTLCATDRCFTSVSKSVFFSSLKVLPVSRGKGVYQQGMDLALDKLSNGDWVHIFPEGTRSRDGGKTLGNIKRGVGRLILDAKNTPIIIPFLHEGMQDVLPIGSKFPHICKKVTVLVGDPISLDDLLARCGDEEIPADVLYDTIAQRIETRMLELKAELQGLIHKNEELAESRKLYLARKASGIWEHVDWEMEGFSVQDIIDQPKATIRNDPRLCQEKTREIHKDHAKNLWYHPQEYPFQSITTRLRAYADPAAFVSFAAKGLAFYIRNKEEVWS